MNLNTKFDVGQTVYDLKNKNKVVIAGIRANITKNETLIYYFSQFEGGIGCIFEENELTAEKPKLTIYDLKPGDEYFLITGDGFVRNAVYFNAENKGSNSLVQWQATACGNVFLTREEAEKEVDRRKIHQKLKRLSNGYEFTAGKPNYYIIYYYPNKYVETTASSDSYCPGIVYFPSEGAVEDAIRKIGEERLIDDYFGVEEA